MRQGKAYYRLRVEGIGVVIKGYPCDFCGRFIRIFSFSQRTQAELNPGQAGQDIVGGVLEIYRILVCESPEGCFCLSTIICQFLANNLS